MSLRATLPTIRAAATAVAATMAIPAMASLFATLFRAIAFHSAARLGDGDFGVSREPVETLRAAFAARYS